ncbi:cation diffusion facilitator family transporter [Propylenella binzhouense]|uniref:Cation transporter n=1 Tax=Propylenella binzhouense TaxID=2555902 RepID=A0A964T7X4_9HYPH|nr:cation diffusion facilitator family transporter [Propylenella binzhouense]MYZ49002.1 cation transporter [Propylenella binzhouense]
MAEEGGPNGDPAAGRSGGARNAGGHGHDHTHAHGHHGHAGHDHGGPGHTHVPEVGSGNRRRVLAAALLTGGFMLAEVVGGLLTGSLALIADAGHMLTDTVSLGLAYVAYRMADRPATQRLTYGFDRLQIVVAYTNGLTIFLIALWILAEAVRRFLVPSEVLGGPMLAVAAIGLLVNIAAFAILHGGDRRSLNLRGALLHVMGDLLGSVAAIAAAAIILLTGWMPADPLLSLLVAVLLLRSAWVLLRDSGLILLEGVPPETDRDAVVADLVRETGGVRDVHHMHVWSLDGRQQLATLHARLDPGAEPDRVIAALKRRLQQAHGIQHATIEVEQGACADTAGPLRRNAGAHP